MPASLKFYSGKGGTETTDPSQVKYICYKDESSNEYSIDYISNDGKLKLGYKPSGGDLIENEIGLTTVDTSTFLNKNSATEADVTSLLSKITTEDNKLVKKSEVYTKTDVDSTFLNKNNATEADVTSLLSKITTEGNKLIKESELPTKIVDNTVTIALSNTFLKKDATNFDSSKQADFLTKLGTNNTQVADKVATSIPSTTKTVLMSVIENHNEEGLVPSYDTLW